MGLTKDELLRLEELVGIIRNSGSVEYEEIEGETIKDEDEDSIPTEKQEEKKEEKPGNIREDLIIYSLALKRLIIERDCELDDILISQYVKKFGGKQKTRMRSALSSKRFKDIYNKIYAKNLQESGADSIFEIPMPKQDVTLSFMDFIGILYETFVNCHNSYKYQIVRLARTAYKTEKNKRLDEEYRIIREFLDYYSKNLDMFDDDKLVKTMEECNSKYGPTFLEDMHPILYVFSSLFRSGMFHILNHPMVGDKIKNWLDIRYDDREDEVKIGKLFVKIFYTEMAGIKKATKLSEDYAKELQDLKDAEKAAKENVRKELIEQDQQIKESRKKDDMKLNLRKKLHKK